MAFLSVAPTQIPEYIGEVQDVGTAQSVSGSGSLDLDTDNKGKGKAQSQTETSPATQTATEPVTVKVPERETAPSPLRQPSPVHVTQPGMLPLPGRQPVQEPAWKPSPVPDTGVLRQPVYAPQVGFKPAPSLTTLSVNNGSKSVLDSVNMYNTDPVKEAGAKPFKNAPQYNTEPVNYSILDGSAKSSQNLQNATAFLSSMFGGSGKGVSESIANRVVDATQELGKAELKALQTVGSLATGKTAVDTLGKAASKVGTAEFFKSALGGSY